MNSPRWKKMLRDLQAARGRMVMMTVAIAVSIFGVGTILGAYTILTREISRNYLGTNPASAFLELDQVDDSLVAAVRQQPNIADAEAGSWVTARVETKPNEFLPLLLLVVKDFETMRISTFSPEAGAFPPPAQTILLEREALTLLKMKIGDTLGARSTQITSMYLVLIATLGAVAVLLGVPPAIFAARGFAAVVGQLLNFTIYSNAIPVWVYIVLLLMGILIPLLTALNPIMRTSRTTVREILSDYGATKEAFGSNRLDNWLSKLRAVDKTLILAIRNTFRRRGRLILTLSLLATAGAMFMTGINVKTGWESYLTKAAADRHYDLEVRFNSPQSEEQVNAILAQLPTVAQAETWSFNPAALSRPDNLNLVRTYPDGGHGSFTLRSAPPESKFIETPLIAGRWLQTGDENSVALNQNAKALFPNAQIGDEISIQINGLDTKFKLVGVIKQVLSPATAYVIPSTYAEATGMTTQTTTAVRVVMTSHDKESVAATTREIEQRFAAGNISVKVAISEALLDNALSGHVYIFIFALILISVIMAVVGALGLMSSMGTSVIERTREFGIMRAIGAKSKTILRNVISEGVFIGLLSWVIALPVSAPLSYGIDYLVGMLSFRSPLPLIISPVGLGIWLIVILIGSIAASAYPAKQASQLTIRETLAYV